MELYKPRTNILRHTIEIKEKLLKLSLESKLKTLRGDLRNLKKEAKNDKKTLEQIKKEFETFKKADEKGIIEDIEEKSSKLIESLNKYNLNFENIIKAINIIEKVENKGLNKEEDRIKKEEKLKKLSKDITEENLNKLIEELKKEIELDKKILNIITFDIKSGHDIGTRMGFSIKSIYSLTKKLRKIELKERKSTDNLDKYIDYRHRAKKLLFVFIIKLLKESQDLFKMIDKLEEIKENQIKNDYINKDLNKIDKIDEKLQLNIALLYVITTYEIENTTKNLEMIKKEEHELKDIA